MSNTQIAKEMLDGQAFVYGEYIVAFSGSRAIFYEKVDKGVPDSYLSKQSECPLDMFLSTCDKSFIDNIANLISGKQVEAIDNSGSAITYRHVGQASKLKFV